MGFRRSAGCQSGRRGFRVQGTCVNSAAGCLLPEHLLLLPEDIVPWTRGFLGGRLPSFRRASPDTEPVLRVSLCQRSSHKSVSSDRTSSSAFLSLLPSSSHLEKSGAHVKIKDPLNAERHRGFLNFLGVYHIQGSFS